MPQPEPVQVHPQFRHRLQELRQAAGLSLREFGKLAHYSHSYLHELERGIKQPTAATAARLDDALSAGGMLSTLVTVPVAELLPSPSVPVSSRNVHMVGFTAAAYLAPAMRWLTSPLDERPVGRGTRLVGPPDVDTISRLTATLRGLDNHYGGGYIYPTVVRLLHGEVTPLLRDGWYDTTTGAALFSAAAELTRLAGWSAYDAGLHGIAQQYLIQALRLAVTATDRPLGAEIIAAMSHQAAYLHAPAEAVDLARAAGRAATDAGVAAIQAEAAVLEAHGHAVAGDEQACAIALDRAERTLDRADRGKDPQWIGYFDEAYLAAKFGHCFAALDRGDLAGQFAARSLDMDARYVRGRQFNLALLATAHAQAGDVEQAAAVGTEAVAAAEGLNSARAVDYLARLAQRLAPYAGLTAVRDFAEHVRPVFAVTGGRSPSPATPPAER